MSQMVPDHPKPYHCKLTNLYSELFFSMCSNSHPSYAITKSITLLHHLNFNIISSVINHPDTLKGCSLQQCKIMTCKRTFAKQMKFTSRSLLSLEVVNKLFSARNKPLHQEKSECLQQKESKTAH
jgi:hypothetical protein